MNTILESKRSVHLLYCVLSTGIRYQFLFWFSSTLTAWATVVCNSHLREEKWYCLNVFILILVIEVVVISIDVTPNEN